MFKRQACFSLTHFREEIVRQLFDFPEYDHPHVQTTAEPAPPPLNNGPSLIPIFPKTFSFSLVYELLRAGIYQSVSDSEVQEFSEQDSMKTEKVISRPQVVNLNGQGTCNICISVIQ